MLDPSSLVPPLIPAVITGVLSAWLTAALAFGRTKKEKLWEARFESYQKILDHLHEIGVGFDNMFEASGRRKDISDNDKKNFHDKYLSGRRSLERFAYTSDLLLDPRVRPMIQKLFTDIDDAENTEQWNTYLEDSSKVVWNAVRDVTMVAKRHLEI